MVTHTSANHGPQLIHSVILWELVFPTWPFTHFLALKYESPGSTEQTKTHRLLRYLHVGGHIVGDDGEQVVGVGLLEVPEDGEVTVLAEQRLLTRLIPRDVVARLLHHHSSSSLASR